MSEETILKAETGKKLDRASWPAVALIGTGVFLLLTNLLHVTLIDYLWPGFIVGAGVLMIWPSYKSTAEQRSKLSFMVVPGAMAVAFGGLLFLMNLVDHFESMAYSWTLILAAGAAGYAYMHRFDESNRAVERAHGFIRTMVLAFMALATLFEVFAFESLGDWWPLLLVGLGVYLYSKNRRSEE